MKKIYVLLLAAVFFVGKSFGQITVTGGTGLAATYPSFSNATTGLFAAINATAQTGNNIVVSITGDVTTEAGAVSLNAGAWASITITPSGPRTISGATGAGNALINLNGADNVTINGLNAGGNSLTISNTLASGTVGTSTIKFTNDATNNTVTNCTVLGSATMPLASIGGTIFFSTSTTIGNDNNTISNCDIGPAGATLPTKAIFSLGSTTNAARRNSGITINNNTIHDFFSATQSVSGIYVSAGNDSWTISNNRIYQTATRTFTSTALRYAGITLINGSTFPGAYTVTSNKIGFGAANGTGTTTITGSTNEVRGLDMPSVDPATVTSVQGNIIAGISQTTARNNTASTANSAFIGMLLGTTDGLFDIGGTAGNTIGSLDGSATIVVNSTSTTASTIPVIGIYDNSFNLTNFANNNMGSITIGGSGTVVGFRGILVGATATVAVTITNNTIGGNVPAGAITDNQVGNYAMYGMQIASADAEVTGNTIRNMAGNANGASSVVSSGILSTGSTGINTFSQNSVYGLSNNSGTISNSIYAIYCSFASTANIIERNTVHSLSITSTALTSQLVGILPVGGSGTYQNNMVRLGLDAAGNPITAGYVMYGIFELAGTNNLYHNSVYIGGSGVVASSNTFAFVSNVSTGTRNYNNNIFWNARSNASGTGKNYAIALGGTTQYPSGLTSNFNDLYADGTGGFVGLYNAIDRTAITDWRTATGQDMTSINADPKFINPTGDATTGDLHLQASPVVTPCEGNGLTGINVTNDFDGQARASLSPVDIGADAGNFTLTDLIGPEIAYSALVNSSCLTANSLTATITDISGVDNNTGTKPRLYYKKSTDANTYVGNTSVDNGWKYVEASNASSPYVFNIDYTIINGGSIAIGNIIQYFVTAQDLVAIPNVSLKSGIYAPALMPASVALTAAAFPLAGTINSYAITAGGLATPTVTIGVGQTYPTLTGAGGLFAAINTAGGITTNITATIMDASITETGANSLNQMGYGCGAASTLTIKPNATGTVLTGSLASSALIKIKSSNVIIDGSSNGTNSQDLTITNTSATNPIVLLIGSALTSAITNTTVKNTIITDGSVTSTGGAAVVVGDGTSIGSPGYFTNITIQNNLIQKAYFGILANAAVSSGNGTGLNISSNNLNSTLTNAIGNTGVYLQGVDGGTISANNIGNFESLTGEIDNGIWLATNTTNTVIEKNTIHDILYTGVSGYAGKGITVSTGLPVANVDIRNNFIYNITGDADSYTSYGGYFSPVGIYAFGTGQGGVNIYYNTIYLSGGTLNFSSDAYSIGIALDNTTTATIKNNIVYNQLGLLTSIGVGAVGIAAQTSISQFTALDYNDYYSSAVLGTNLIGKIGTSNYATLATWQAAAGQEVHSLNVAPVFASTTDLHLTAANNCGLDGYGTPVAGITTDYDSPTAIPPTTRDLGAPDMGADEFNGTNSGAMAVAATYSTSATVIRNISPSGTTFVTPTCDILATITPAGAAPVSGSLKVSVTRDALAPQMFYNAQPYVNRHYDIEPATNPNTATATVKMYFTDQDFIDYNTNNVSWPKLPTLAGGGNGDANIVNLHVTQYHGTPNHALPSVAGDYSAGTADYFNAPLVNWNGSYWEVTVPATGFSGFYVYTSYYTAPLPITLNYLRGSKQGSIHNLNWSVTCNATPTATLELERSANGANFKTINTINATALRCQQPFDYADVAPLAGINYYRLKMTDANGKFSYSNVVTLINAIKGLDVLNIAPNPVTGGSFKLNVSSAKATSMQVVITDMQGRVVSKQNVSLIAGFNTLEMNVSTLASGTYNIYGSTADERTKVLRFVKN